MEIDAELSKLAAETSQVVSLINPAKTYMVHRSLEAKCREIIGNMQPSPYLRFFFNESYHIACDGLTEPLVFLRL